jgi:hypothetical protein
VASSGLLMKHRYLDAPRDRDRETRSEEEVLSTRAAAEAHRLIDHVPQEGHRESRWYLGWRVRRATCNHKEPQTNPGCLPQRITTNKPGVHLRSALHAPPGSATPRSKRE